MFKKRLTKQNLLISSLLLLFWSNTAYADPMAERIAQLESELSQLKQQVAESSSAQKLETSGILKDIANRVETSGLIEVEGSYMVGSDDKKGESDIVLATVELGASAAINDYVTGSVVLLYEEDVTEPMEIDTASISIGNADEWPLSVTAGKIYVPFGNFNSYFISDPLTLELAETRETALLLAVTGEYGQASLSVFNGDIDAVDSDNHVNGFVAAAAVNPNEYIEIGASYINNIAESEVLQEEFDGEIASTVGGWSVYALVEYESLSLSGEYVTAIDSFNSEELDFAENGSGDKPASWNIEAAWAINDQLEAAARYAGSSDFLDFPKTSYGTAITYGLWEDTSLSFEWLRNKYDIDPSDHLITGQLATEF